MVMWAEDRIKLPSGLTEEVAEWAFELQFNDLSAGVVSKVKYMCLDLVGQIIGGAVPGLAIASLGGSQPVINFARNFPGSCTVMGTQITTLPQYAALANGSSGTVLALLDTHRYSKPTHFGSTLYSAAFAASQMITTDFPTFATAVVLGYEVAAKLAMALQPGKHTIDAIQANTFGAAIQTAKFLGLNKRQFTDCLGLAGSITSGSWEYVGPGHTSRGNNFGWHAHNGIVVPLLVKEGQPGPPTMIEGPYGFLLTYSNNPNWQILRQLGQPYEITRNAVKLNPVSRSLSSMVDATLALVKQNNIQPQDVKQIIIEVPRSIHDIIARESLKDPEIPEEARSSSYYWAAVAVVEKRVWLDGFDAEIFESPEVRSLAQKVRCLHNQELDEDFPEKLPSVVKVELNNDQSFCARVDYPRGEPENPVSWEELMQRNDAIFNYCAKRAFTEERYSEIISRIQHMEKERDIGKLVSLFASNMS